MKRTIFTHNRDSWSLVAVIGVAFAMLGLMLAFESQWALVAEIAVGAVTWFVIRRTSLAGRAQRAASTQPTLTNILVATGCIVIAVLFRSDDYSLLMLSTVLLYAVACIGLNIQTGLTGLANFAGAAFFACGGYTLAYLLRSTTILSTFAIVAGGLVSAVIGLVLMLPVLRTKGYYSVLVTIAFGVLCSSFLQVNDGLGGAQGLSVPGLHMLGWDMSSSPSVGGSDVSFYLAYVLVSLVLFLVASMLMRAVEWSFIGINLDTVRSDETVGISFGMNLSRWKVIAFMLGNLIIGIAGAVYGGMTGFVSPAGATFEQSLLLISIVVLGGIGNTLGALLAAVLIILVPEKLHALQEYRTLIFSVAVVVILLFRPRGLLPRTLRDLSSVFGGERG
ncbi:branched-chain amino acid ABC transporter permease [Caballeronia sordidicola]|uniref:Branched-chain amino acid transport system permease protein LivM n=1 Tax=Caballeronia sordidicola TaxID=196367 RepID=A0A242MVC0_CABSO|nr:branched-chain amino acid ABC transporter permease [Caballeronia sordidicola]OTP75064.1 Branched-chain amino acid transport system permease protein LivM [Caballeronia sordidicola]